LRVSKSGIETSSMRRARMPAKRELTMWQLRQTGLMRRAEAVAGLALAIGALTYKSVTQPTAPRDEPEPKRSLGASCPGAGVACE
jgi:hypothetical protein